MQGERHGGARQRLLPLVTMAPSLPSYGLSPPGSGWRGGRMRKWVFPGEDRVAGRADARRGLTAGSTCIRLACYGLIFRRRGHLSLPCLPFLFLSTSCPCSPRPLPVSHPSLFSPDAPSPSPAWPSRQLTYPQSGLPRRSQVGSGRCSGQGQSPDSPGGHTVGMTNTTGIYMGLSLLGRHGESMYLPIHGTCSVRGTPTRKPP